MKHIIFLVLVVYSASSTSSEFSRGENLITPYQMDPENWEVLTKEVGSFRSLLWRSKEKGFEDIYVVNIHGRDKTKLNRMREIQDNVGQEQCPNFVSTTLDPIPNTNYKSVLWRTACERSADSKVQILQLAIKGKDSNYHLQKIWRYSVSEEIVVEWIKKFNEVFLCDTRKKKKQCPSDYRRVKDV